MVTLIINGTKLKKKFDVKTASEMIKLHKMSVSNKIRNILTEEGVSHIKIADEIEEELMEALDKPSYLQVNDIDKKLLIGIDHSFFAESEDIKVFKESDEDEEDDGRNYLLFGEDGIVAL